MEPRSRLLMFFSYMGTRFSGVQKQAQNITVQGVLDNALSVVLQTPQSQIQTAVSSRTDSGVHALQNSALVDIPADRRGLLGIRPPYDLHVLRDGLNRLLEELELEVRVGRLVAVAPGFRAQQHALGRSYTYRIAALARPHRGVPASALLPVFECDRAWAVDAGFDPLRAAEFARMLTGRHNFASFMATPTDPFAKLKANTERSIERLEVCEGRACLSADLDPTVDRFHFYDIHVHSKGFLYQQVRRITSTIVAGGRGLISKEDVEWMLANPSPSSWSRIEQPIAPPSGLYLARVHYDEAHFTHPPPLLRYNNLSAPHPPSSTSID